MANRRHMLSTRTSNTANKGDIQGHRKHLSSRRNKPMLRTKSNHRRKRSMRPSISSSNRSRYNLVSIIRHLRKIPNIQMITRFKRSPNRGSSRHSSHSNPDSRTLLLIRLQSLQLIKANNLFYRLLAIPCPNPVPRRHRRYQQS